MNQIKKKYLRFTAETNALDFLEKANTFIRQTEVDLLAWKWVVLCLHSAIYGFAISACKGTDDLSVIQRKGKLISIHEAITRCKNLNANHRQALVLSSQQEKSLQKLTTDFRNQFEHYQPSGWSIEVHGFPKIAIDALDIIRFLAVESSTLIHHSTTQIRRIKSIVYQCKKILKNLKLHQEAIT